MRQQVEAEITARAGWSVEEQKRRPKRTELLEYEKLRGATAAVAVKFPRDGGQGAENLRKQNRHVHENQTEPKELRP